MRVAVIDIHELDELIAQGKPIKDVKDIMTIMPNTSVFVKEMRRERIQEMLMEIKKIAGNKTIKLIDINFHKLRMKYSISHLVLYDLVQSGAVDIYKDHHKNYHVLKFISDCDLYEASCFLNKKIRNYSIQKEQKYRNAKDR